MAGRVEGVERLLREDGVHLLLGVRLLGRALLRLGCGDLFLDRGDASGPLGDGGTVGFFLGLLFRDLLVFILKGCLRVIHAALAGHARGRFLHVHHFLCLVYGHSLLVELLGFGSQLRDTFEPRLLFFLKAF